MILHITNRTDWDAAQESGHYTAPSLTTEGYIHCSTEVQMQRTANKYYAGVQNLILLEIDPARLNAPLRMEPAGSWLLENPGRPHSEYIGDLYPHIYGPIPVESVIRVIPYALNADGAFGPPPV